MPRDNEGRQFSEDIDRLLQGKEPVARRDDLDYADTVLFARRLVGLREEPQPEFVGRLKRRLLTDMASQDAQATESGSWLMRLFAHPGLRVAMVSTFVMLAAVGLIWRAGLLSPGMSQAPDAEPGMLMAPPAPSLPEAGFPEMARAADDAKNQAGGEATMTSTAPSPIVILAYSTPSVTSGEDVDISVMFQNHGPDGYVLTPFPPAIAIRETATGRVVYTFAAGTSSNVLSAMESLRYEVVWNQEDARGLQVAPGRYEVVVELTEAKPESGDWTVSAGSHDATEFDILSRTTNGMEEDSDPSQE